MAVSGVAPYIKQVARVKMSSSLEEIDVRRFLAILTCVFRQTLAMPQPPVRCLQQAVRRSPGPCDPVPANLDVTNLA